MSIPIYKKDIPQTVIPLWDAGMKKLNIKEGSTVSRETFKNIVLENFKVVFNWRDPGEVKEDMTVEQKKEIYEALGLDPDLATEDEVVVDADGNEHKAADIVEACKARFYGNPATAPWKAPPKLAQ